MLRQVFTLSLLYIINVVVGQSPLSINIETKNKFYTIVSINATSGGNSVELSSAFTGVTLHFPENFNLANASLETEWGSYRLINDPHQPDVNASQLIVFRKPLSNFILQLDTEGIVEVHLFNAMTSPVIPNTGSYKNNADSCNEPESIHPSIWRAGLDSPALEPVLTIVEHTIVHHTAGSNSNTDYIDVIRNIYLLHTQTNGWNDIGYNYVIAQDGTIFQARDDQGIYERDYILGAHFCSKNTGTMGISMMGNYMTVAPPDSQWNSLKKILAWKLNKDSLDPFGSYPHPIPNGPNLDVIAGHRQGCSTSCPGDLAFPKLPGLRQDINSMILACNPPITGVGVEEKIYITLYPVPARNQLTIKSRNQILSLIRIYNMQGQLSIFKTDFNTNELLEIRQLIPGNYLLSYFSREYSGTIMFIKE